MGIKGFFSIFIIIVSIIFTVYYSVFDVILQLEHILILCFVIMFLLILLNKKDLNLTWKQTFTSTIVTSVILFIVIFVIAGNCIDIIHSNNFNEEIDQLGEHTTTFVIQNVSDQFVQLFFIYDEDGRSFAINETAFNQLNQEYNNHPIGHKITVNFTNSDDRAHDSMYCVNSITTESGKVILSKTTIN